MFTLVITNLILVILFVFIPHTVELTEVIDTWFPYKGLVMYKDFPITHTPLGRFLIVPLHLLSNWNLEVDPFLGLAIGILSLYIVYVFGKRFLSKRGTQISLIFFTIFYWYYATSIMYFHEMFIGLTLAIALFVYYKIHEEKKISYLNLSILGFFLAAAELSGQVASGSVLVFGVLTLYLIYKKTKTKNFVKPMLYFSLGGLICLIPILIYFISQNALGDFYYWNVSYYTTYLSNTDERSVSRIPLREVVASYIPLIFLSFAYLYKLLKKQKISHKLWTILLLSYSTIPLNIFSVFHFHHLNYSLPILSIAAGISIDEIKRNTILKLNFWGSAFVFMFILYKSIIPWYLERPVSSPSLRIKNDLYPDSQDPMYTAVQWIKDNTDSDTKLLVVGDSLFYFRSDRLPASRPSKSMPYSWEPFSEVKNELADSPPDYWVIDRRFVINRLLKEYDRPYMVEFIDETLSVCYKQEVVFENWEIWSRSCL